MQSLLIDVQSGWNMVESFLVGGPNGIAAIYVEAAVMPVHHVFDDGIGD